MANTNSAISDYIRNAPNHHYYIDRKGNSYGGSWNRSAGSGNQDVLDSEKVRNCLPEHLRGLSKEELSEMILGGKVDPSTIKKAVESAKGKKTYDTWDEYTRAVEEANRTHQGYVNNPLYLYDEQKTFSKEYFDRIADRWEQKGWLENPKIKWSDTSG